MKDIEKFKSAFGENDCRDMMATMWKMKNILGCIKSMEPFQIRKRYSSRGLDSDQRGFFSILFDAYTEFNVEDFINFFEKGITQNVNVRLRLNFLNKRVLEDEELQQALSAATPYVGYSAEWFNKYNTMTLEQFEEELAIISKKEHSVSADFCYLPYAIISDAIDGHKPKVKYDWSNIKLAKHGEKRAETNYMYIDFIQMAYFGVENYDVDS